MIDLPRIDLVKEIESAIDRHRITRKELFAKAKVDQTNLEKWRNGAIPTLPVVTKVINAINALDGRKHKAQARSS